MIINYLLVIFKPLLSNYTFNSNFPVIIGLFMILRKYYGNLTLEYFIALLNNLIDGCSKPINNEPIQHFDTLCIISFVA